MKRVLLAVIILFSGYAFGQTTALLPQGGLGVSCNAVTAASSINPGLAGGCTALALVTSGGALPGNYTWQTIVTGSPASVSVTFVGSLDGVTGWTVLDTNTSTTGTTRSVSNATAYRFLGCVPGTLSGGSSPTITCQISVTSTSSGGGGGTGTVTNTGASMPNNAVLLGNTAPDLKASTTATDDGTTFTYTGTGGILSSGAGGLKAGANGGAAGLITGFGSTSGTATLTWPAVAGTNTNPITVSNGILGPQINLAFCAGNQQACFGSNGSSAFNIQAGASAVIFGDTQSILTQSTAFLHPVARNILFVTSNFTTAANTNLQTITGLAWTAVANRAGNYIFHCALAYSQATANAAVAFGIQAATNSPTNIFATGTEQITVGPPATFVTGILPTLTTTTATAIVSGTPGATATNYTVTLDGTLELAASANTINFMVSTATSGDAVTVLRGSYCELF